MKLYSGIFDRGIAVRAALSGALQRALASLQLCRRWVLNSDLCLLGWIIGSASLLTVAPLPELPYLPALLAALAITSIRYRWLLPVLMLCLAVGFACWRFSGHLQPVLNAQTEGATIQVVGQVMGLPAVDTTRSRLRFKIDYATQTDGDSTRELPQLHERLVQLTCYRCSLTILPNQRWKFSVRLKRPHGYASWGAFDYEKYLFRHQVSASGYIRNKDNNVLLAAGSWSENTLRWQLREDLRLWLADSPDALAIMAALVIGDKSLMSDRQRQVFQNTGVSHLMAISGLHIGLVFLVVVFLCKWILMPFAKIFDWQPRQRLVLLPALAAALGYSALAGFAVSTQRAFIMLCVFVVCRLCARDISLLRMLMIAAAVILVLDPFSILDVGYWLSCGAVLIIALATDPQRQLSLWRLQPLLWLGLMPLTVLFFGQISIISPLVNLLMVPLFCLVLIPLALFSLLLLALGLSTVHIWLLSLLGVAFEFVFSCLSWLHEMPFSVYYPPAVTPWQLTAAGVLALAYALNWRLRHFLLVPVLATLAYNPKHLAADEVLIAMLDVGQGLSIVVEARDYVLVYDTGPAYPSGFSAADAVLIPYLRHRGIKRIDMLIISHADNDHIGGYPALQDSFKIDQTLTSSPDQIPGAGACLTGQSWQAQAITFQILSPDIQTVLSNNNRSCVLMIENSKYRALITGDIESSAEHILVAGKQSLLADFMLVPHHGSKTSSTASFIDAINPRLAVLSAGYLNRYGHPHRQVTERYKNRNIELESTVESGTILLNFNANGWYQRHYRSTAKGFWHIQKKPN